MFQQSFSSKRTAGGGRRTSSSFGGKRNFNRFSSRGTSTKRKGKYIDPAKFVKKIVSKKEADVFEPKNLFANFEIHEKLKANILSHGYEKPTPIQDQAIPEILAGRDLIGIANTGTGKTAAFLIPLIHKIFKNKTSKVLIVTPTRDLANQIDEEFKEFSKGSGLQSVICIGGANISRQMRDLSSRPNFVIGTPGRLKDLIKRKTLNLSAFDHVVLDEVDRMLDMGFIQDVRMLIGLLAPKRQSLFFSATMPEEIVKLASQFIHNPVRVEVKSSSTSDNVEQDVVRVDGKQDKIEILHELLVKTTFQKVLIFGRTKFGVQKLSESLVQRGFRADSIHGNHPQGRRERALRNFRDGKTTVLVATDVAARGLDIPNVTHVINYDIPENYEDYIHRIGRTGRGNNLGKALTFI